MVPLASCCDVIMILIPLPVKYRIAETCRKVLCKFEVNQTYSSRVTTIFVPAPQFLKTVPVPWYLWALMMSKPPEPASGSGIFVQAPLNVPMPAYDWNAPDQIQESWLFKCQFTSWKKICWIIRWGGLPSLHPGQGRVYCHGLLDANWSCRQKWCWEVS